jgi:hypothetical protein
MVLTDKGIFIVFRWRGSISIIGKFQIGVDKKLNRIAERIREQFAWRSSKLATTGDDNSIKADNQKKRRLLLRLRQIARKFL